MDPSLRLLSTTWFPIINAIALIFGNQVTAEECTVSTSQGNVRGETIWFTYDGSPSINQTIDVFKGIPYAEPPVGPNRFRKPVPKAPWETTLNTTTFRSICWQFPEFDIIPPQSEDCLFLNIWSPSVKVT
ncbi:Acetylcholinesterase [Holothuria leucospilota]|uniref:Acetylcholinesterase n=1 Tax=Holothuria leucospilota TaxID=206669 RepID=A0A9Q1C2Y5_HOLLE|nr:Acetylcholinesterase [Holothuria leucospilota]